MRRARFKFRDAPLVLCDDLRHDASHATRANEAEAYEDDEDAVSDDSEPRLVCGDRQGDEDAASEEVLDAQTSPGGDQTSGVLDRGR